MQFKGLEEATIATIVGVIIQIVKMVIPGWSWEEFKWRNLVRLGMCQVVSYGIFALSCYTTVDIPGMEPVCGAQGAFNAGVAGILAFLVQKYAEEEATRWIRKQIDNIIWLPLAVAGLATEVAAIVLGWPFMLQLLIMGITTLATYVSGLRGKRTRGILNIRFSTIMFILLFVFKGIVEAPGNPLGLNVILRAVALVFIWGSVMIISLLTRVGVIREK